MASISSCWAPTLLREFYESVEGLQALTDTPAKPRSYRDRLDPPSDGHILSFGDELQLADDLAFLAQDNRDSKNVSAVTIQENPDGIHAIVSGNSTPTESLITGLQDILDTTSGPAVLGDQGENRPAFLRSLLRKVVDLRKPRILHQSQGSTGRKSKSRRGIETSRLPQILHSVLQQQSAAAEQQLLLDLLARTEAFDRTLHQSYGLEAESPETINQVLHNLAAHCVDLVTSTGSSSLGEYLKSLAIPPDLSESPAVRQVDELARCSLVCTRLADLADKPEYGGLFARVKVLRLEAPFIQGVDSAFVHAEIQQVLHHERHTRRPRPRAIGSSKPACYLCDLFVEKQDRYQVSETHGRLYGHWTLPGIDWMTESQAEELGSVLRSMIQDVREKVNH
ncbi:hypothetical protein GE09DRAFT_283243 [Coniochaeta sp. 2T2.1]|nr:hypothetical protein GE09DRAFT_283243 [Coniochaeta sp. 2T2.1]